MYFQRDRLPLGPTAIHAGSSRNAAAKTAAAARCRGGSSGSSESTDPLSPGL